MRLVPFVLSALAFTLAAAAQTPACQLGTAQRVLSTPALQASLFNTGSLFFGGSTTNGDGYIVPRYRQRSPLFMAGLWVGATVDGEVRVAGARYTNFNFWPGPVDPGGTPPNPTDCSGWDRIYLVTPADVVAYENGGAPTPDLAAWPVGLGARAVDPAGQPVVPTSRAQTVDLVAGERPVLYGGPTAFWVMNDAGQPVHSGSGSAPLGIEVRVTAFASIGGPEARRAATVYRYEIINRNTVPLGDLHAGVFADPDLGAAIDDYIGTDTTRAMAFAYNADDLDEGQTGYGIPPALGLDVLSGLWASTYFNGGGPGGTTDPSLAAPMYNFLQGTWGDGTPMRELGTGYAQPPTAPITRYMFPGDPVTGSAWSEVNNGTATPVNAPGDRRLVATALPVTLAPGAMHAFDVAVLFAQGADRFDSITRLREASDLMQALYDDGTLYDGTVLPAPPPPGPTTLLTPADDADFNATRPSEVTFTWTPVAEAHAYRFQISSSPDFVDSLSGNYNVVTTELSLGYRQLPIHDSTWTYWRVFPVSLSGEAATAEVRRFAYTAFQGYFTSFEVVANASGPVIPPQPGAAHFPRAFFPTPFDDSPTRGVQQSLSMNAWLFFTSGAFGTYDEWIGRTTRNGGNSPAIFPFDFEMRFTGSSLAAVMGRFGQTGADITVPFELWNIGSATPDDPSDDVRLIPVMIDLDRNGAYGPVGDGAGSFLDSPLSSNPDDPYTDAVFWMEPADTSPGTAGYDAYVAARMATPGDTTAIGAEVFAHTALVSWNGRTRASTPATALPEPGTVFRIWTSGPSFVADEPAAEPGALSLGVYPNPARGMATVPYTLAAAGAVRLSVVDVLGREVAVLVDGERAAGAQTASLDASRLASGVYGVVLRTGDERTVRRLTVVR